MSSLVSLIAQPPPTAPAPSALQLGGTGQLQQFLQQMNPQQLQSLLGLTTAEDQQKINQGQLAQSEAMRKQLAGAHAYGLGGGIGNGLAEILSGVGEHVARNKQEDVLAGQRADRGSLLELLKSQAVSPASAGHAQPGDLDAAIGAPPAPVSMGHAAPLDLATAQLGTPDAPPKHPDGTSDDLLQVMYGDAATQKQGGRAGDLDAALARLRLAQPTQQSPVASNAAPFSF